MSDVSRLQRRASRRPCPASVPACQGHEDILTTRARGMRRRELGPSTLGVGRTCYGARGGGGGRRAAEGGGTQKKGPSRHKSIAGGDPGTKRGGRRVGRAARPLRRCELPQTAQLPRIRALHGLQRSSGSKPSEIKFRDITTTAFKTAAWRIRVLRVWYRVWYRVCIKCGVTRHRGCCVTVILF